MDTTSFVFHHAPFAVWVDFFSFFFVEMKNKLVFSHVKAEIVTTSWCGGG